MTSDLTLLIIGILLAILAVIAWSMSNRAEATPNEDQIAEMRRFVNDHFAKYVARGLVAEGVGPVAISQDPAWRNVYLQHLRLHNELHPFVPGTQTWWAPIVSFACGGPIGLVVLVVRTRPPQAGSMWWAPIVYFSVAGLLGIVPLWIIRQGVSPKIALRIFEADVDEAVRRELEALRRPARARTRPSRRRRPRPSKGGAAGATTSGGRRPRSAARTPRPASPGTGSRGSVAPPPSP